MTKDFADFLDSLNKEGVQYVVIGGMAVLRLIPYRTTRDIDVLIAPEEANAKAARKAVAAWLGEEPDFDVAAFLSGDILSFGGLLRVEIHTRVPGVDWTTVESRRVEAEFLGVPTWFASLEDMIAMKRAAGRPEKDLPDLARLEELRSAMKDEP